MRNTKASLQARRGARSNGTQRRAPTEHSSQTKRRLQQNVVKAINILTLQSSVLLQQNVVKYKK